MTPTAIPEFETSLEKELEKEKRLQEAERLRDMVHKHHILGVWLSASELEEFEEVMATRISAAEQHGFSDVDVISALFEETWLGKKCDCASCNVKAEKFLYCICLPCRLRKKFSEFRQVGDG